MWLGLTLPSKAPSEESVLLRQYALLSLARLSLPLTSLLPTQLLFTVQPGGREHGMIQTAGRSPVLGLSVCSLPSTLPQPLV